MAYFGFERQLTEKITSMDDTDDNIIINHTNHISATDFANTFVFKPLREEWIKTKPPIVIEKKFCLINDRLCFPASNCKVSLNQRFSEIQNQLLKHPIYSLFSNNNTLFSNSHQDSLLNTDNRKVFTNYGRYFPRYIKPLYEKTVKNATNQSHSKLIKPDLDENSFQNYLQLFHQLSKYTSGPSKTKEELDQEIDNYMAKKEIPNVDFKVSQQTSLSAMMKAIKRLSKSNLIHFSKEHIISLIKSKLDSDLDIYMCQSLKVDQKKYHCFSTDLDENENWDQTYFKDKVSFDN